jgi:hypothetical protein
MQTLEVRGLEVTDKLKKFDIEGLSALELRMALILLRENGIENAKEFIRKVKEERIESC